MVTAMLAEVDSLTLRDGSTPAGAFAPGLAARLRARTRARALDRALAAGVAGAAVLCAAPALMRTRLVLSIVATTVGLAFWWALTEPLPVPPVILLGVPAAIVFCAGLIAGRLGVLASGQPQ